MRTRTLGVLSTAAAALLLTSCAVQIPPSDDESLSAAAEPNRCPASTSATAPFMPLRRRRSAARSPLVQRELAVHRPDRDNINDEAGIAGEYPVEVIMADNQ